jgi:hypothetical protein
LSGHETRRDPEADLELLRRHRPLLRFDRQYDYRVLAASSAVENPGNLLRRDDGEVIARAHEPPPLDLDTLTRYPEERGRARPDDCISMAPDYLGDARRMEWDPEHNGRLYGRVVEDGGWTWLQYWFWLYYNPKNLFGFGKHEGDWELVQVGLGADGRPAVATYAQHAAGEARGWSRVSRAPGDPLRPLVHVAPLSHASYFEGGTHPYPIGIDNPSVTGPDSDLPVVPFGPWVHWPGRWGNTENVIAGRLGNGPPSPARQGLKWTRPAEWHGQMRARRGRAALGRALHRLGRLTYPPAPVLRARRLDERAVAIDFELSGSGIREGRHLQLTVHHSHLVLASRVVRDAPRAGVETLILPAGREPTIAWGSTFNGLRQRSDLAPAPIGAPARLPAVAEAAGER